MPVKKTFSFFDVTVICCLSLFALAAKRAVHNVTMLSKLKHNEWIEKMIFGLASSVCMYCIHKVKNNKPWKILWGCILIVTMDEPPLGLRVFYVVNRKNSSYTHCKYTIKSIGIYSTLTLFWPYSKSKLELESNSSETLQVNCKFIWDSIPIFIW